MSLRQMLLTLFVLFSCVTTVSAQGDSPSDLQPARSVRVSLSDAGCEAPSPTMSAAAADFACGCQEPERCSLWTLTADALFLQRSDPANAVLAFNTVDPTQNLNASDFNFGVHIGYDLSATRTFGTSNALELRFFSVDQWNSAAAVATTPGDLLRVNAAVPIFTFTGDAIQAAYVSNLDNAEANGHHRVNDWLDLLAGFRYVGLDESSTLQLVNSAVPFDYQVATRNRLYGFQLGGVVQLWNGPSERLALDVVGKAGIFGNQASQNSSYSTGLVTLPAAGRSNSTAFVGELGLSATYRLTERLALRGGYRLLWIDGVALATDQLAVSDFALGTGFNRTGDVFYHGAFAGLEATW